MTTAKTRLHWWPGHDRLEYATHSEHLYRITPAEYGGFRLIRTPTTQHTLKHRRTRWLPTRTEAKQTAEQWARPPDTEMMPRGPQQHTTESSDV